jgi:hypothetical protein
MRQQRPFRPVQQLPRSPQGSQRVTLLTEREAAERCRYFDRGCAHPIRAFRQWADRKAIPFKSVARQRLYDPRVLEAVMDGDPWTLRRVG